MENARQHENSNRGIGHPRPRVAHWNVDGRHEPDPFSLSQGFLGDHESAKKVEKRERKSLMERTRRSLNGIG